MLALILILVVALPIAWLASEFQSRKEIRIALGIAAIAMAFGVAWIVGSLDRLNSNMWYGDATKDLIQNTIVELERGHDDRVLTELRVLRSKFHPTYESRAAYDELVADYVTAVSNKPILHERGDPRWVHETPTESGPLEPGAKTEP